MKHVVGVADMRISASSEDSLVTYALGSCLGVTIHDPVAHVGGLLHVMLPLSTIDPAKATENPHMFVDTGLPKLFLDAYKVGARKERLIVKVAGGACANSNGKEDYFHIGKRNLIMLRQLLWKNGVLIRAMDVAGSISRTMSLDIATGQVLIRSNGSTNPL